MDGIGASVSLKRGRLSDEVFRRLTAMIASGELQPGELLPSVRVLGQTFTVSSRVAREAMAALAARGLVQIQQGRGCFVAPRDQWRLVDRDLIALIGRDHALPALFEVRATFEVGMASLAARRRTSADLEALAAALDRTEADRSPEAQVEGDREFHQALALATHNPLFLPLLTALLGPLHQYWTLSQKFADTANLTYHGHRAIFDWVAAGDEDGAARAMIDHLRAGQEICERLLEVAPVDPQPTVQEVPNGEMA